MEIPKDDSGGRGGGDRRLLYHIFVATGDDGLGLAADHVQRAQSILTGIAANRSMETGQLNSVEDLIRDRPHHESLLI